MRFGDYDAGTKMYTQGEFLNYNILTIINFPINSEFIKNYNFWNFKIPTFLYLRDIFSNSLYCFALFKNT